VNPLLLLAAGYGAWCAWRKYTAKAELAPLMAPDRIVVAPQDAQSIRLPTAEGGYASMAEAQKAAQEIYGAKGVAMYSDARWWPANGGGA
jgi:hypothetical protein